MERRRIRERTMKAKEVRRRAGFYPESAHTLPYGVTYRTEAGPDAGIAASPCGSEEMNT